MPEPVATGTLDKTPLPHLLIYLEQKRLSGTLAIWPDSVDQSSPQGQDRILLLKGHPVAGRLIEPAASLREGMLRLFERNQAPYAFYESNLLGDDRLSGRVDPFSLIAESLRSVARDDVVEQVLARVNGKLRILPGIDLQRYELNTSERALIELLQAEPASVAELTESAPLPATATRRVLYLLVITKAVAPVQDTPNTPAPRPSAQTAEPQPPPHAIAPPPPAARAIAPVIAPPAAAGQPIAPPQAATPAAPRTPPPADEAGSAPVPEADPMSVPLDDSEARFQALDRLNSIPPPPDALDEELRARWQRIVAKGRLIENQSYFEMLDVPRETAASDARAKFYELAKEWHPDRLPKELAPLRDYVQIIFSYLSEASTTLGNEDERLKYIQTLREGGGTPRTDRLMQSILDSAMEYERVLVMSRKHEYDAALQVLQKILDAIKDEPDYHAMHAWLLLQKSQGKQSSDAPLQRMLASAERAIELYPRHEKGNLYKAQILRRMGKTDQALAAFRKVVEINPNNIEAAREVRVAAMRKGNAAGKGKKDEKGGLLGKFFGKK